jgi:hypothetical protein
MTYRTLASRFAPGFSFLVLLGLAAPAAGQEASEADFAERKVERPGETYTLVSYKDGKRYRRIEISDLRDVALGNTQLAELPVCVEGKFEKLLSDNSLKLMDSDRKFVVADPARIAGLLSKENLWIGGVAKPMPGGGSYYVAVSEIYTLKADADLFRERLEKLRRARDWRKLIALGHWIKANHKLIESTTVIDGDVYDGMRNTAIRHGLSIRTRGLAADDVEARFEIARMYRSLLKDDRSAAAHLRHVLKLDPAHEAAARALRGLGYVLHEGDWITHAEHAERLRKLQLAAAKPDKGDDRTKPLPEPHRLVAKGQSRRLLEIDRRARRGPELITALTTRVHREEDELVARRFVWILANTGGAIGLDGLLRGMRSEKAGVRRDVADALAWCGCVQDLVTMVRSEETVDVRSHAVAALGSVRTRKSIDGLVALLDLKDTTTRSQVSAELARGTGQTLSDPGAWRTWWEQNSAGYKEPEDAIH